MALAPAGRPGDWKLLGPYMSERAWGTVREDYSADGKAWEYFPHEHARSRAYRWNEDGLAGICDIGQRMCFALSLWNGWQLWGRRGCDPRRGGRVLQGQSWPYQTADSLEPRTNG